MNAPALPKAPGSFVKVELSSVGGARASWEKPVHAYFRNNDGTWQLVGFERLPHD